MKNLGNFSIRHKRSNFKKILLYLTVIVLLVFLLNIFYIPLKSGFNFIFSPFTNLFWKAGGLSSSFLGSLLNLVNFSNQNKQLENKNQELLVQVSYLQSIISANQAQSNVSASCQNDNFKLKMVQIQGYSKSDVITINVGSKNGILVNMPVISQQKALLGNISKVFDNYSEVTLISSIKSNGVNVKILCLLKNLSENQTCSSIDGLVKGKGGGKIYLDLAPIFETLNIDDVLITSGLDGIFPKNLLVGKITKITKDDQKPYQQADVNPFFDIKADNFFVITDYKK
jgi:rod shape-determining protein MreC